MQLASMTLKSSTQALAEVQGDIHSEKRQATQRCCNHKLLPRAIRASNSAEQNLTEWKEGSSEAVDNKEALPSLLTNEKLYKSEQS